MIFAIEQMSELEELLESHHCTDIEDLTRQIIELFASNRFERVVSPKTAEDNGKEDAIKEIINQLGKYLQNGSIDFMCVNLEGIEKRLRKALKV
uniref:Uncharacterized protein n=1 Tax=viral metagenome TaxID=1070528 RepID=A0A6M3KXT4_9ZZZZ